MVLSWIQELIQKLKKEDEFESDDPYLHNDKPELLFHKSNPNSIKDVDARISYQYPKNHIRSSPIHKPSETGIPKIKPERSSGRKKLDLSNLAPVQEPVSRKEPISQNENTSQKRQVFKKEPISRSHGPFHPTEIPSPVFGFNRPKTQDPVIEYELGYFLENDSLTAHEPLMKQERLKVDDGRDDEESNSRSKQHSTEEEGTDAAKIHSVATNSPEQSKNSSITWEPPKEFEISRMAVEPSVEVENKIETMEALLKLESNSGSTDSPVKFESNSVNTEVPVKPENRFVSVENEVEPNNEEQDVMPGGGKRNPENNAPGVEDISSNAIHEVAYVDETDLNDTFETSTGKTDTVVHTDQSPSDEEERKTERPRRSHLPFNVLMLKQDRESWASKGVNQTRGVKQEQPPVVAQVNAVPEPQNQPEMQQITEQISDSELFQFPTTSLLTPPIVEGNDTEWIENQQEVLNLTLQNFNVGASVVNVTQGPAVTRFEVQPEPGVKVNKITNLSDDIKLSLAARDIRIEAPIPGKHTIGIEVPNKKARPVFISEIIQSSVFRNSPSPLTAVLGLDIGGSPIVTDLKKMPHGLIAGATGSGKSVCINSILVSLLYKATPDDLKLLLIDPKMVELAPYNRIPHLVSPVITDVKAATASLKWAVDEMERRYELFVHAGVRDIGRFNDLAMEHKQYADKLPYIVIVIDELADLMMMSPADVEEAICRIAQKARACGIHLIVATQRPSVDVITGLIKANIPTRIAFSVSSQVDSRTIIDISGAEKLLGRGDMLFLENGSSKPVRLQGSYVSDEEIDRIADYVRSQREPDYLFEQEELLKKAQVTSDEDELFYDACEFIIDQGGASTSSLQRRFKIGYNRAARLMDMLEDNGYISGANGSKPRDVLITEADLESIQDSMLHS
nr:DNA translocase FtsK [Neobacillus dielmonensis]